MIYKICGKDSFSYDQIQIIEKKQNIAHKLEKTKYINPLNNSEISIEISLDKRYAGKISRDALNFLKRLLDPNPQTRIKSDEIFDHPYLLNYYDIFMANNELYVNNFDNNSIKSPNVKGMNFTMINNTNTSKKNKTNLENNNTSNNFGEFYNYGNYQNNNNNKTDSKNPEKNNLKISISNNNFYNNGINSQKNNNTNIPSNEKNNKNNFNQSSYTNLNSLNKANIVPIIENICEDTDTNENIQSNSRPLEELISPQFKNDNQIYKESINKLFSDTPKNIANQLFNKKNLGISLSKKIQENVDGENYNLVDPYDKEADDYKLNEDANMETLKPVVKEDRNNYNYYNNIKLYNEDLFEKTAKIKKSLNPYESIYKFSSQINKEKDKKSKKDKEKINNNNNNSSNLNINNNSNKNININTSNNYSSSISHISKDKESNHNNVQTRTNNFIAKDLLAISEMQQNQQNKNKGAQSFYTNFEKAKVFLSPQKLQETSPMFYNPGEMKFNNYSNSVVHEKEKKVNNNEKNMLNDFKNLAFGVKPNNFNKAPLDSYSSFNSPDNFGNLTNKGFVNNMVNISNNMNNTILNNNNNYSNILSNQNSNANSNNKITKKTRKDSNISKSINFNSTKIANGFVLNNVNKENQGQINDFLKNLIYQNGLNTVKNNNNDHKRNSSLSNHNGYLINAEENKKNNSLKKLQLPIIVNKEVGNKV